MVNDWLFPRPGRLRFSPDQILGRQRARRYRSAQWPSEDGGYSTQPERKDTIVSGSLLHRGYAALYKMLRRKRRRLEMHFAKVAFASPSHDPLKMATVLQRLR